VPSLPIERRQPLSIRVRDVVYGGVLPSFAVLIYIVDAARAVGDRAAEVRAGRVPAGRSSPSSSSAQAGG